MEREDWNRVIDTLAAGDFISGSAFARIYTRHQIGPGNAEYSRLMRIQDETRYRWMRRLRLAMGWAER